MSATAAVRKALPLRPASSARSRPKLVVIASGRPVGRTPFVVLVGGLMLAGLIALLMLHTLAAQDAFRQTSLQQRLAALTDTEQQLEQKVQVDSSPITLRQRAKALGLVPSVVTGYHRRADGRVVAREVPATSVSPATAAATSTSATSTSATSTSATSTSATTKHHRHGAPRR